MEAPLASSAAASERKMLPPLHSIWQNKTVAVAADQNTGQQRDGLHSPHVMEVRKDHIREPFPREPRRRPARVKVKISWCGTAWCSRM